MRGLFYLLESPPDRSCTRSPLSWPRKKLTISEIATRSPPVSTSPPSTPPKTWGRPAGPPSTQTALPHRGPRHPDRSLGPGSPFGSNACPRPGAIRSSCCSPSLDSYYSSDRDWQPLTCPMFKQGPRFPGSFFGSFACWP